MRAGVVSPVASLNPRFCEPWEQEAGIDAIAAVAQAADRLGYHHVTCSEHIAIAEDKLHLRGVAYWDPLATLGYLAARTTRVRLATHVLVLGMHHPLMIAKRYGTLDRISGGRVVLGVGVGSAEEEFELLGLPWHGRGARADDALRALRASFGVRQPEYSGTHYAYSGWVVEPHGVQQRVPLWIGGRSERSLRRAVELGDGWAPQGAKHERLAGMIDRCRQSEAYAARTHPLEIILATPPELDPGNEPDRLAEEIAALERLGATMINVRVRHESLAHCLEQLEAYAGVAASTGLVRFETDAPAVG